MPNFPISTLPAEMLTANGTHRYYSDAIRETCSMVERLNSGQAPVFAIEAVYQGNMTSRVHCHERGQITYVQAGTMTITTEDYMLVVPTGHAVWIPPHHYHQAAASLELSVLTVYASEGALPHLPDRCCVLQVSDLFEPLFKRLIARQILGQVDMVSEALVLLLYDEVRISRRLDATAPLPKDPRLLRVCSAILKEPTIANSKEELARIGNMSLRTMTRLFRSELNMTYSDWVQQALGYFAIGRLSNGQPVSQVAADLGYASPSAFTAMFRRRFGFCPSDLTAPQGPRGPR